MTAVVVYVVIRVRHRYKIRIQRRHQQEKIHEAFILLNIASAGLFVGYAED